MKVGVIIAAHNREKYIATAIESVFRQTRPPQSLVVVDDASTDQTLNTALGLFDKRPKAISCFPLILDKQSNPALVKQAGAWFLNDMDVLFCLDSDDFIAPGYIDSAVNIFNENPKVAIAYPDMAYFASDVDATNYYDPSFFRERQDFVVPEFDIDAFRRHNWICGCSPVRAEAFWQVGGWQDKQFYDRYLWTQIVTSNWTAKRMPNVFYYYRQHPNQLSRTRPVSLRQQGHQDINDLWGQYDAKKGTP